MSKWIKFKETFNTGKTKVWQIVSKDKGTELGLIKWYSPWRKYSFYPHAFTVYETTCMMDIVTFITKQMEARKP